MSELDVTSSQPYLAEGLVTDWLAFTAWKGAQGISRLLELASDAQVQVMQSADGVYQGSLHKRSSRLMPFSSVLQALFSPAAGGHLYLAQSTMWASPDTEAPLSALMQDIATPACLAGVAMQQINLWLSASACHNHQHHLTSWADKGQLQGRSSRSSLHYDCHANLLCVVTGSKRVHLVHPDLTPCVYPLPLWGQSSNHSAVDFAQPDAVKHPRFQEALQAQQSFDLQAGDALLIPEGWWHQVDSDPATLAVNFWWASKPGAPVLPGPYQLRRTLQELTEARMTAELEKLKQPSPDSHTEQVSQPSSKRQRRSGNSSPEMEQSAENGPCHSKPGPSDAPSDVHSVPFSNAAWLAQQTPWEVIASMQWSLKTLPEACKRVLEGRILPAAAELLTRSLEAADAAAAEVEGSAEKLQQLYELLYGLSEKPEIIFDMLLKSKEEFAEECYRSVLADHVLPIIS